jgi:hypothetical protein
MTEIDMSNDAEYIGDEIAAERELISNFLKPILRKNAEKCLTIFYESRIEGEFKPDGDLENDIDLIIDSELEDMLDTIYDSIDDDFETHMNNVEKDIENLIFDEDEAGEFIDFEDGEDGDIVFPDDDELAAMTETSDDDEILSTLEDVHNSPAALETDLYDSDYYFNGIEPDVTEEKENKPFKSPFDFGWDSISIKE